MARIFNVNQGVLLMLAGHVLLVSCNQTNKPVSGNSVSSAAPATQAVELPHQRPKPTDEPQATTISATPAEEPRPKSRFVSLGSPTGVGCLVGKPPKLSRDAAQLHLLLGAPTRKRRAASLVDLRTLAVEPAGRMRRMQGIPLTRSEEKNGAIFATMETLDGSTTLELKNDRRVLAAIEFARPRWPHPLAKRDPNLQSLDNDCLGMGMADSKLFTHASSSVAVVQIEWSIPDMCQQRPRRCSVLVVELER